LSLLLHIRFDLLLLDKKKSDWFNLSAIFGEGWAK